jgi:uncharacterized protein YndB with AHSA1/START domain
MKPPATDVSTLPSTVHDTFILERNYPVSPDRLFAAFADPAKKRHWFVESHGNQVDHYEMDFRAGGKEQVRFRFKPGSPSPARPASTTPPTSTSSPTSASSSLPS